VVLVAFVPGGTVSRTCISEDYANDRENQHWCGAAHTTLAVREGKRGFLFQFCTARVGRDVWHTARPDLRKTLMGLAQAML
jgi:hypothetical protein